MTKQYETLYVFGDSFSTPNYFVNPKESFWGLLADYANVNTIINYSRLAHPWDGVKQTLVSESNSIKWETSLLLIGIPPLERLLVFDDHQDTTWNYYKFDKNWNEEQSIVECERGLISRRHYETPADVAIFADRSWVETFTLRDLFLIDKWLTSVNANYMFINLGGKDFDRNNMWGPSSFVLPYFLNHDRSILFENGYHSINEQDEIMPPDGHDGLGYMGHHGPEGNANFFQKSLLPKLKDVKLI